MLQTIKTHVVASTIALVVLLVSVISVSDTHFSSAANPTMSFNETQGKVGAKIDATIRGFQPSESIALSWKDDTEGALLATGQTDGAGTATIQFTVPAGVRGVHTVVAVGTDGNRATAEFKIIPRIRVSPRSAPGGMEIEISVRGFAANEPLGIRWYEPGVPGFITLATVTTSNTGSANTLITVPIDASVGVHKIEAGQTGGNRASTSFTVLAANATPAAPPIASPNPGS